MPSSDHQDLICTLTFLMASGKLEATDVLPTLGKLIADESNSMHVDTVIAALVELRTDEATDLIAKLRKARIQEAAKYFEQRRLGDPILTGFEFMLGDLPLGAPIGWVSNDAALVTLRESLRLARDWRFVRGEQKHAPQTAAHIEDKYQDALNNGPIIAGDVSDAIILQLTKQLQAKLASADEFQNEHANAHLSKLHSVAQQLESSIVELDEIDVQGLMAKLNSERDSGVRQKLIDEYCTNPNVEMAQVLLGCQFDFEEKQRVTLILTSRFGSQPINGWNAWVNWLRRCERQRDVEQKKISEFLNAGLGELFLLWYAAQPDADVGLIVAIDEWCQNTTAKLNADRFVERWSSIVPALE